MTTVSNNPNFVHNNTKNNPNFRHTTIENCPNYVKSLKLTLIFAVLAN
jgi:hypothetical protein